MSRHFLMQAIRVSGSSAATCSVFGRQIPTDQDYAVSAPAFGELVGAEGSVVVRVQRRGTQGLPLASPRVTAWIWKRLQRHPIGTPTEDPEGKARRLVKLREFLAEAVLDRPEHTLFIVGHPGHYGAGACGLPIEDVVSCVRERWPSLSSEDAETHVRSAIEGGTFYRFDEVGIAGDEAAEQEKAKVEALAKQVEVENTTPNTDTLDDRGWLGIEWTKDVDPPGPIRVYLADGYAVGSRAYQDGDRRYCFFPRKLVAQASFPEGVIEYGVNVLDGAFVIPGTKKQVDEYAKFVESRPYVLSEREGREPQRILTETAATFAEWLFSFVRPRLGIETSTPRTTEFDEASADGRHRVELFEALIQDEFLPYGRKWISGTSAPSFDFWCGLAFRAGTEGLSLADDVVVSKLYPLMRAKWARGTTAPMRSIGIEDAEGNWQSKTVTWDEAEQHRVKEAKKNAGTYKPKPWEPQEPPAWMSSEEALLDRCRAIQGKPLFAVDELYVEPGPGIVDRMKSLLSFKDDWAPTIQAFVEGKELVRTAEIDDELRRAGLVAGQLSTPQYGRVARIMTKLGWVKTERVVDGRKTKVWAKTPGAEKWAR